MHNQAVQELLCTEPKGNPEEALFFAFAFEEVLKRQASYRECKLEAKSQPSSVCLITKTGKVYHRCGAHIFIPQYIPRSEPVKGKYGQCEITGRFDSGSPGTIFTIKDLKDILCTYYSHYS